MIICLWRVLACRGALAAPYARRDEVGSLGSDADLRVSDRDRDRVVETLSRHHADGRLDAEEFGRRVDATLRARTRADLAANLSDLPALDGPRRVDVFGWRFVAPMAVVLTIAFGTAVVFSGGRALFGLWWLAVLFVIAWRLRQGGYRGRRRTHRPEAARGTSY